MVVFIKTAFTKSKKLFKCGIAKPLYVMKPSFIKLTSDFNYQRKFKKNVHQATWLDISKGKQIHRAYTKTLVIL